MHRGTLGTSLKWGDAALCLHPLLSLLGDGEEQRIDKPFAHACCITAVAVADGGSGSGCPAVVLSADDEGWLKCWALRLVPHPAALSLVAAHALHAGAISFLELHTASGLLATAGDDGCVRLWHLPQLLKCAAGRHAAAQLTCLTHGHGITAVAFSGCGTFLASAALDGTVRLWQTTAHEPLAVLQLAAASLAFAPGDDTALLVAATGPGQGPQLLDLRRVPACRRYCTQLAAAQAAAEQGGGSPGCGGQGRARQQPAAKAALDPAVWLPPASHAPRPAVAAPAAAATPRQQEAVQAAAAQRSAAPGSGGGSGGRRQVGSLVTFGRRRQRRQEEAAAEEEQQSTAAAVAAAAAAAAGIDSWLPDDDTHLRPLAADGAGAGLFGDWALPLLPTGPPQPCDDGCVPEAAVAARIEAPADDSGSSGKGVWDAGSRSFVYRQGGHSAPVCWAALLPAGLHVLTASTDGEAKLWTASSSSSGVCCTLLPAPDDHWADCCLRCRPAIAPDGRHVVCGGPSGALACWDLQQLQSTAHLPLNARRSNAAAVAWVHKSPVTAVAVASLGGDWLLASGDAGGRLHVRWR